MCYKCHAHKPSIRSDYRATSIYSKIDKNKRRKYTMCLLRFVVKCTDTVTCKV